MDNKLKIAIIGIGKWGKNLLKEYTLQADVVWCAYKGDEETKKFLETFYPTVQNTTSYEDILNDPSVDAVVVATPTSTHFEIAQKVLQSNKHLFLEKPGCSTHRELQKLCTEAEYRNLTFVVGYEFAHHPILSKIKNIIGDKKINFIFTEWFKWGSFTDPTLPHLLSHELSILKILGADDILATHIHQQKIISTSDIVHTELKTTIGNVLSIINRVSPEKRKTVTIHTDSEMLIWNNDDLFSIDIENKTLISVPIDKTSAVSCEITAFLNALTKKQRALTDGRFALEILRQIEAISPY